MTQFVVNENKNQFWNDGSGQNNKIKISFRAQKPSFYTLC